MIKSILLVLCCLFSLSAGALESNLRGQAQAQQAAANAQTEQEGQPQKDNEEGALRNDVPILQQARMACATIIEHKHTDFDMCVNDVVMVKDVGMAGMWEHVYVDGKKGGKKQKLNATQEARMACAALLDETEFALCVEQVSQTGDWKMAELWDKKMQQQRQQDDEDGDRRRNLVRKIVVP